MGARYYQPELGRWTQPDPSGQEANAYLYVGGNPVNFVDPSGLAAEFKDCLIFRYNNESGSCFGGSIGLDDVTGLLERVDRVLAAGGGCRAGARVGTAAGAFLGAASAGTAAAASVPLGAAIGCVGGAGIAAAVSDTMAPGSPGPFGF